VSGRIASAADSRRGGKVAEVAAALAAAPRLTRLLGLVLGMSVARQACLLGMPLLTMHVFDSVIASGNLDTLTILGLAFVVALVMAGALRAVRSALMSALAEDMARRLSLEALQTAVRSALSGSRRPGLAALQDTAELRRFLGGGSLADLFDMVGVPIVLFVLYLLHPVYAVVVGAACLLLGVLGVVLDRTTRGMLREASDRQLQTAGELQGRLRQADLLEGLGMLGAVVRRWEPAQAAALHGSDAAQARARALRGITEFLGYAIQGLVVLVGVVLALGDQASPGSIIAAMMLTGNATNPIARIVLGWRDWSLAALAWRRLQDLFATFAPPAPLPPRSDTGAGLTLWNIGFTPPEAARPVLDSLSVHCPPGTLTLVTGPNGAGKSSMLRAALGLLPGAKGVAVLDGADLATADRAVIGPAIGYLPQDVQLLEGSVMDNIARFNEGDPEGAVEAAREAGAHAMIGRLPQGYGSEAGPAGGLSMGQRRMVGLARALYGKPRLLVLDEPEAGLDADGRQAARDAVLAARAGGAACLVVSHDPALWQGHVDQVVRLAPGGHFTVETRR
jgi:ATP-binding cassette subfamily C protein